MNNILGQGLHVADGPVVDETGGDDASLHRISDDQNIASEISQDPIVKKGVGHYENFTMLSFTARPQRAESMKQAEAKT